MRRCNTTLDFTEGTPCPCSTAHFLLPYLAQVQLQGASPPSSYPPQLLCFSSPSLLSSACTLHPHPLFVLLPHPGSSLLHLVFWPHTAAARSKETTLGQTQTFLSMLFAWSQYLHDKQRWTNTGLLRKSQCIGLNPARNSCGRNQALTPDPDPVEQLLFSRSWVLKNCDSPSCTQTQMIILS